METKILKINYLNLLLNKLEKKLINHLAPSPQIEGNIKNKCENEWNRKQMHNVESQQCLKLFF